MWSCAFWKIFKIMMPHDQSRLCPDQLHPRHTRVTIRIHQVNVPGDKNALVICASRRKHESTENCDFDNSEDCANHPFNPNAQSAMRNGNFRQFAKSSASERRGPKSRELIHNRALTVSEALQRNAKHEARLSNISGHSGCGASSTLNRDSSRRSE